MLSSYFANYLPLSRHHRTHKNGPRDNDSPNPLRLQPPVTPQQQSMTHPYPGFGGLKSNGGAAVNGTLFDEQRSLFSMSNLCSSSPASPHHHHSNNLQNVNKVSSISGEWIDSEHEHPHCQNITRNQRLEQLTISHAIIHINHHIQWPFTRYKNTSSAGIRSRIPTWDI
eukprot:scaffold117932_cov42-Cyclotella_meneghiniana.AAC.2